MTRSAAGDHELLTVVIPCLNEADAIGATVDEIMDVAPSLDVDVDVVMIDDGSTDGTRGQMERLVERYPRVRMMVNEKNLGPGLSAQRAFQTIDLDSWVTAMPGDHELVFASIRNFLGLREDYDLILGYLQNPVIRPIARRAASAAFTTVARALYGFPYRYLNGMKLYRLRVFHGIELVSGGHAINAELIAKALLRNPQLRVGEAPFVMRGRSSGHSKAMRPSSVLRAVSETYRGLASVGRYRRKVIRSESDE